MTKTTKTILVAGALALGLGYVGHGIMNETNEATASGNYNPGRPVKNETALKAPALASSDRPLVVKEISLSKDNLVVFREGFNAMSVAIAQAELLEKNSKLGAGKPIYLVLDTPGGSIDAGNSLIDTAKSLGRPVHTITVFAASMGFNTAQRLDTRYILPSGTLMAHRARVGGVGGQIPGEFLTAASMLYSLVKKQEMYNAKRLRISFEQYTELVRDEYWVDGEDAVRQGAADELASLKCDDSLKGTSKQTVYTMFGPVEIIWNNCPAVTYPVGVAFGPDENKNEAIRQLMANYRSFRRGSVEHTAQAGLLKQ